MIHFSLGDVLRIESSEFQIIGIIKYQMYGSTDTWEEYRMINLATNEERWLSIDNQYQEYSIWKMVGNPDRSAYHKSDSGTEVVIAHYGNVDVDIGDKASFVEYEDPTEELLISYENWDDEREVSAGVYLDADEIVFLRNDPVKRFSAGLSGGVGGGLFDQSSKRTLIIIAAACLLIFVIPSLSSMLSDSFFKVNIQKHLKKDSSYTYVTSITGSGKEKAHVYQASPGYSVDAVSKDIIAAIDGDTQYVQQDTEEENGSVAILTKDEYCIVYTAEDGNVLVQVSDRKYAYTSDSNVYHGTTHTHRYYRRFYYTTGYSSDVSSYSSSYSPYSSFDGGTIDYNGADSYNSYSGTVRQSSLNSRSSSGGGLSSGK